MGREEGRCRSCGAPILWAITTAGKPMPVDAVPDPAGNVSVEREAGRLVARVHTEPSLFGEPRHMPHHATCPQGTEWKKRRT